MNTKSICRSSDHKPKFSKKDFLKNYMVKQKQVGQTQRNYKKILLTRLKGRQDTILETNFQHTVKQLEQERNNIRANLWVATGTSNLLTNSRYIQNITCHINCQEELTQDIKKLKTNIFNMEREIIRKNREIYELQRITLPDSMFLIHVARERKKLNILENMLEVGMRRECGFMEANAKLREEIKSILSYRAFFNNFYAKLVHKLKYDKKYVSELIEYAIRSYNNCFEIFEKMDYSINRRQKQNELQKMEVQHLQLKIIANQELYSFIDLKNKTRELDDLQPKEYNRREASRKENKKNINVYNKVINNILEFTKSDHVEEVIDKYMEQESLYYTYFCYANEQSYHMTLLNNAVNNLYTEIASVNHRNYDTKQKQLDTIEHLEKRLEEKRAKNKELQKKRDANDHHVQRILDNIQDLFEVSEADATPLMDLLGDHKIINLNNMRTNLKVLENRVKDIVAVVYVTEREERPLSPFNEYTIEEVFKLTEPITNLNDIVLTQQCPECAEGEAFNIEDADDGGVLIHTNKEIKQRLYEKIKQPEMQYYLHSLSQCRLPRSNAIAAQRNL